MVSEVLNVLTPRIMTLISDALSAQEAAAAAEAKRQEALLFAQQQEALRQAALAAAEEQRRKAAAAAAAAAANNAQSDSSLDGLFGDGKTHYVHIEVPGVFKEEYNLA